MQTNADQPALLYRGTTEGAGNWVEFRLTGTKSNRDAIGARIKITAGGATQIREIDGGNGYAGESMRRAHFGIGAAQKIDSVEISWPSGRKEKVAKTTINAINAIVEGQSNP